MASQDMKNNEESRGKKEAIKEILEHQKKSPLAKVGLLSGHPGVFYIIREKDGKVVLIKSLLDNSIRPVFANESFIPFSTIYVETTSEKPASIIDVFINMYKFSGGNKIELPDENKEALYEFFGKIVPDFNKEKVATSHIKKFIKWYNTIYDKSIFEELLEYTGEKKKEEKEPETIVEQPPVEQQVKKAPSKTKGRKKKEAADTTEKKQKKSTKKGGQKKTKQSTGKTKRQK